MQYEIKTDIFGDEELVMLSNVEQIRTQCQPYIEKVKNTDLLTSELKLFIKEVRFLSPSAILYCIVSFFYSTDTYLFL